MDGWPSPAGDNRWDRAGGTRAGEGRGTRQLTAWERRLYVTRFCCYLPHLRQHLCRPGVPLWRVLGSFPAPSPTPCSLQSHSSHICFSLSASAVDQLIFSTVHCFVSTKQSHAVCYDCGYHHQHYLSNTSQGWDLGQRDSGRYLWWGEAQMGQGFLGPLPMLHLPPYESSCPEMEIISRADLSGGLGHLTVPTPGLHVPV